MNGGVEFLTDYWFVRKYSSLEPSWNFFGEEQIASDYGSPTKMYEDNMWQWTYFTWKNNLIPIGTTIGWRIYYQDTSGNTDFTNIMAFTIVDSYPDLECEGELSWNKIEPGETVNGEFTVLNCGDDDSELDWEISETPEWGTSWIFDPSSGTGLTPAQGGQKVQVQVIAPNNPGTEFNGKIKVINSNDSNDFCEIPVYLKTPRSKSTNYIMILRLLERFPFFQKLLNIINTNL